MKADQVGQVGHGISTALVMLVTCIPVFLYTVALIVEFCEGGSKFIEVVTETM